MKGLRVTKIVKKIRLKRPGVVRIKIKSPETITHKIFETNSSFHVK